MHARGNKLAVYTTVYPAVLKYLPEWYGSVQAQLDRDFELWIGLDELTRTDIESTLGQGIKARWVQSRENPTPASIRDLALGQMAVAGCDVVLVDSDDILCASRVGRAREALRTSDLAGCALEIVDESGRSLDAEFNLDPAVRASQVLPRNNVFGFSNSAYRCDLIEHCPSLLRARQWTDVARRIGRIADFAREPLADDRIESRKSHDSRKVTGGKLQLYRDARVATRRGTTIARDARPAVAAEDQSDSRDDSGAPFRRQAGPLAHRRGKGMAWCRGRAAGPARLSDAVLRRADVAHVGKRVVHERGCPAMGRPHC